MIEATTTLTRAESAPGRESLEAIEPLLQPDLPANVRPGAWIVYEGQGVVGLVIPEIVPIQLRFRHPRSVL